MIDDHTDPPQDDKTQIAQPAPDDDRTQIAQSQDDRTEIAPMRLTPEDRTEIAPDATAPVPPPAPRPDITPPPSNTANAPVPIGTLINNNYEIKELINAGGMGEVFRGENVATGDAVAIKIVLQSLANDEKVAALFMREAKVLFQLSDQAIVRFYNFVHDADLDRFCLIMEFINGCALSDHIRDVAPLTLDQATRLMRRLAAGLDRAHQMEVIHRDLSPDNVMLRDGLIEDAVLIDFGIAKSTEMAESTLHGQLAGKFKYISPEQLGHFGGEIGPRTDIYGLGLLMSAAVRGKPLDMGSSIVEAVNARREIPDLSDIEPTLRPLLAHMLEPDPADRPARMQDVIGMLDAPETIPAKYGAGPVPQPTTSNIAGPPPAISAPGLRQSPLQAPTTLGFGDTKTDPGSTSPFGATTGLDDFAPPPEPPAKDRGGILRWLLVLLIFAGIGGFIAIQQGWIGERTPQVLPPTPLPEDIATPDDAPLSREGFLAAWSDDTCTYATRIQAGPNSGTITAFSSTEAAFDGLLDKYEDLFGGRPTLNYLQISAAQCPVLALANAVRDIDGAPPFLSLDSNVMDSDGTIIGQIGNLSDRPAWLALVVETGQTYNLNSLMKTQSNDSATFDLSLQAGQSGNPAPQVILGIATDIPLRTAAASGDGRSATTLLPLIEAEIKERGLEVGIAVTGFTLRP